MDLINYLKQPGVTQQSLAEAILADDAKGVTQGAVSQWLRKGVPAERVLQLVRVSGGVMTASELRPDLYPMPERNHGPPIDRDRTTADGSGAAGATICHGQKADVEQQTPGNEDDAALNAA